MSQTANQLPLNAKVAPYQGKPTIFINDQPHAPFLYALTDVPGGRWSWEEVPQYMLKTFGEAGVRLFQLDIFLDHLWFEDGSFSVAMAQKQIQGLRAVCPEAAVFFRFHVNAPKWWIKQHPEEITRYADTDPIPDTPWGLIRIIEDDNKASTRPSMASTKWLESASEKLVRFCREFSQTPEGNALVGIQVACGVYGEWHYWGFFNNEPDVSEPMNRYFREWLKAKYKTEKAIQKAWNRKEITFEKASVPDLVARHTTQAGVFRDPDKERAVIDYYECQHQLVADNIIHFSRLVKQNWPRPIITGTFYGYYFSCFSRDAAGGHLQLQRILNAPEVDYLSAPNAYYPESSATGDPYRSRSLIMSGRLHNKLFLDEMDQRPDLNPGDNGLANIRRNVMFTFTKGMGLWFYDFGAAGFHKKEYPKSGWWDTPQFMAEIKQLKILADDYLNHPYQSDADVLFVYDTDCFYHLGTIQDVDPVSHIAQNWTSLAAYRSGAVFDPVHLGDLEKVNWSQYKVVVFANTFLLNQEQKDFIKNKVAKEDRHLVWIYAPGYTDGNRLSVQFSSSVSEIGLEPINIEKIPEITISPDVVQDLKWELGKKTFSPLLAVNDPQAKILGNFMGTTNGAFARKDLKEHTSWFISRPPTNEKLLQYIFKEADAHIYNEIGDIFYAGHGVLCFHTKAAGKHSVTLKNGLKVELDIPKGGGTVVLDSETGKKVMD